MKILSDPLYGILLPEAQKFMAIAAAKQMVLMFKLDMRIGDEAIKHSLYWINQDPTINNALGKYEFYNLGDRGIWRKSNDGNQISFQKSVEEDVKKSISVNELVKVVEASQNEDNES
jgi:hypothetical protein